jgi:hypothetical protein
MARIARDGLQLLLPLSALLLALQGTACAGSPSAAAPAASSRQGVRTVDGNTGAPARAMPLAAKGSLKAG